MPGGGPPAPGTRQANAEMRDRLRDLEDLRRAFGKDRDLARGMDQAIQALTQLANQGYRDDMQTANLLKTQLGLNEEGMRQLSDVNQRFDRQRRDLLRREMMTRRGMFDEVLKGDSANAGRVDQFIDEQFKIERERIDLTQAEQKFYLDSTSPSDELDDLNLLGLTP